MKETGDRRDAHHFLRPESGNVPSVLGFRPELIGYPRKVPPKRSLDGASSRVKRTHSQGHPPSHQVGPRISAPHLRPHTEHRSVTNASAALSCAMPQKWSPP